MQGLEKQTSEFELHPSGTREPKKDLCHLLSPDGTEGENFLFKRQDEDGKEARRPGSKSENSDLKL